MHYIPHIQHTHGIGYLSALLWTPPPGLGIGSNPSMSVSSSCDSEQGPSHLGVKLAPFNPTHELGLAIAIDLLKLTPADVLADIGCGDARLLVQASLQCGTRGIGIEYDATLCEKARTRIGLAGVTNIQVFHADATTFDYSEASAIFVYLLPQGLRAIQPKLCEALARGARIVSYVFAIPDLVACEVRPSHSCTCIRISI